MSMVMAMPPEPKQVGAAEVKRLTARSDLPIPTKLSLGEKIVHIADLIWSIDHFRHQREVLKSGNQWWPCVRVNQGEPNPERKGYLAPLDLGTSPNPKDDYAYVASGRAANIAAKVAAAAGFKIQEVPPDEANETFSEMLGELIGKRAVGIGNTGNNPPPNLFEVTTDSPALEIVYSVGYFVSTKQGFGFSSPARRNLHSGSYLFGANIGGSTQFSDTLWSVPEISSIHLQL